MIFQIGALFQNPKCSMGKPQFPRGFSGMFLDGTLADRYAAFNHNFPGNLETARNQDA
jgi:hypothetical protein